MRPSTLRREIVLVWRRLPRLICIKVARASTHDSLKHFTSRNLISLTEPPNISGSTPKRHLSDTFMTVNHYSTSAMDPRFWLRRTIRPFGRRAPIRACTIQENAKRCLCEGKVAKTYMFLFIKNISIIRGFGGSCFFDGELSWRASSLKTSLVGELLLWRWAELKSFVFEDEHS